MWDLCWMNDKVLSTGSDGRILLWTFSKSWFSSQGKFHLIYAFIWIKPVELLMSVVQWLPNWDPLFTTWSYRDCWKSRVIRWIVFRRRRRAAACRLIKMMASAASSSVPKMDVFIRSLPTFFFFVRLKSGRIIKYPLKISSLFEAS